MMKEGIQKFASQLTFTPEIKNKEKLKKFSKFVVCGMGGSNHATDLLKAWRSELDIVVWRNYGLPKISDLENTLLVAVSYSGNTEETIDGLANALKEGLPALVISTGGALLEMANSYEIPYIVIPDTKIEPRSAVGFMFRALLSVVLPSALSETEKLSEAMPTTELETQGKELASHMKGYVPVVYTSARNEVIANNWKIRINETGKIPAYYDVFPELNHNEINGFDRGGSAGQLKSGFYFLFLKDSDDHPRILKRMDATEKIYRDRDIKTESVEMGGADRLEKLFQSVQLADWTAYYSALEYGLTPEGAPMVEEFKKLIK